MRQEEVQVAEFTGEITAIIFKIRRGKNELHIQAPVLVGLITLHSKVFLFFVQELSAA